MLEILKKAFALEDIKTETASTGFIMGEKITKYYIPQDHFEKVAQNFPFIFNAVKAGLIQLDRRKKSYVATSEVISYRASDVRKMGRKQFFSIEGNDPTERTTLHDALVTIGNLQQVANKFQIDPRMLKFSIRHKDGNPDEVVNFIKLDAKMFGDTPEEITKNVSKINNVVKFERSKVYG